MTHTSQRTAAIEAMLAEEAARYADPTPRDEVAIAEAVAIRYAEIITVEELREIDSMRSTEGVEQFLASGETLTLDALRQMAHQDDVRLMDRRAADLIGDAAAARCWARPDCVPVLTTAISLARYSALQALRARIDVLASDHDDWASLVPVVAASMAGEQR